jgi:hypothetical protein
MLFLDDERKLRVPPADERPLDEVYASLMCRQRRQPPIL